MLMSSFYKCVVVVLFVASLLLSTPAPAKSVKDFEALPTSEQNAYLISFLEKMTSDIGQGNPELAQGIRDYFGRKQPGKPFSEGLEKVFVELAVLERRAKEGRADLSKVQIESIVVYVVKQKFPPPAR
jgi:hypothetical protein